MTYTKVPNTCSQCGAVLTRRNNSLVCEYCGQEYSAPTQYVEAKRSEKQEEIHPTEKEPQQEPIGSQTEPEEQSNTASTASMKPQKTKRKSNPFNHVRTLFFLPFICYFAYFGYGVASDFYAQRHQIPTAQAIERRNKTATEQAYINLSLAQKILLNYYDSISYPNDFIDEKDVPGVLVLENTGSNDQIFSLYMQNNTGEELNRPENPAQLLLTSVSGSDDLGGQYNCGFETTPNIYYFSNGEIKNIGKIHCYGKMDPAPTTLQIDIDTSSRGMYSFRIPMTTEINDQ